MVGIVEPIGQVRLFLLEEPDILLQFAIDEVAYEIHVWIGGGAESATKTWRSQGSSMQSLRSCSLPFDFLCEEERLAAPIDIAETLDLLVVIVIHAQPIRRPDNFDAIGAFDQPASEKAPMSTNTA
ncbi:hypothetical protein SB748_27900 [Rhizobium sp. SIMBA_035]